MEKGPDWSTSRNTRDPDNGMGHIDTPVNTIPGRIPIRHVSGPRAIRRDQTNTLRRVPVHRLRHDPVHRLRHDRPLPSLVPL